jgi:hypothetical protein
MPACAVLRSMIVEDERESEGRINYHSIDLDKDAAASFALPKLILVVVCALFMHYAESLLFVLRSIYPTKKSSIERIWHMFGYCHHDYSW